MKQRKRAKKNKAEGFVWVGTGAFLLGFCVYHQSVDPVQYPWSISPYLFPVILAAILLLLGVMQLLRRSNRGTAEEERS